MDKDDGASITSSTDSSAAHTTTTSESSLTSVTSMSDGARSPRPSISIETNTIATTTTTIAPASSVPKSKPRPLDPLLIGSFPQPPTHIPLTPTTPTALMYRSSPTTPTSFGSTPIPPPPSLPPSAPLPPLPPVPDSASLSSSFRFGGWSTRSASSVRLSIGDADEGKKSTEAVEQQEQNEVAQLHLRPKSSSISSVTSSASSMTRPTMQQQRQGLTVDDYDDLTRTSISPMPPLSDIENDEDEHAAPTSMQKSLPTPPSSESSSSPSNTYRDADSRHTRDQPRHRQANESISSIDFRDLLALDDDYAEERQFDPSGSAAVPVADEETVPSSASAASASGAGGAGAHKAHASVADPIDPQLLHLQMRASRSRSASHKHVLSLRSRSKSRQRLAGLKQTPPPEGSLPPLPDEPPGTNFASADPAGPSFASAAPDANDVSSLDAATSSGLPSELTDGSHDAALPASGARSPSPDISTLLESTPRPFSVSRPTSSASSVSVSRSTSKSSSLARTSSAMSLRSLSAVDEESKREGRIFTPSDLVSSSVPTSEPNDARRRVSEGSNAASVSASATSPGATSLRKSSDPGVPRFAPTSLKLTPSAGPKRTNSVDDADDLHLEDLVTERMIRRNKRKLKRDEKGHDSVFPDEAIVGGSDSDDSGSSIDLHTPLPHLMLKHGLLSPHSKLLKGYYTSSPSSAGYGRPDSVVSYAGSTLTTASKLSKDTRDTPMRRTRHRDGRLLRGGLGLTTGLGWSDSEDEDAPSALTKRISSLNLTRQSSTSSMHSTYSFHSSSQGLFRSPTASTASSSRTHHQSLPSRMRHPLSRSHSSSALVEEAEYPDDRADHERPRSHSHSVVSHSLPARRSRKPDFVAGGPRRASDYDVDLLLDEKGPEFKRPDVVLSGGSSRIDEQAEEDAYDEFGMKTTVPSRPPPATPSRPNSRSRTRSRLGSTASSTTRRGRAPSNASMSSASRLSTASNTSAASDNAATTGQDFASRSFSFSSRSIAMPSRIGGAGSATATSPPVREDGTLSAPGMGRTPSSSFGSNSSTTTAASSNPPMTPKDEAVSEFGSLGGADKNKTLPPVPRSGLGSIRRMPGSANLSAAAGTADGGGILRPRTTSFGFNKSVSSASSSGIIKPPLPSSTASTTLRSPQLPALAPQSHSPLSTPRPLKLPQSQFSYGRGGGADRAPVPVPSVLHTNGSPASALSRSVYGASPRSASSALSRSTMLSPTMASMSTMSSPALAASPVAKEGGEKPKPRTGTGMVYRTSSSSSLGASRMRVPSGSLLKGPGVGLRSPSVGVKVGPGANSTEGSVGIAL